MRAIEANSARSSATFLVAALTSTANSSASTMTLFVMALNRLSNSSAISAVAVSEVLISALAASTAAASSAFCAANVPTLAGAAGSGVTAGTFTGPNNSSSASPTPLSRAALLLSWASVFAASSVVELAVASFNFWNAVAISAMPVSAAATISSIFGRYSERSITAFTSSMFSSAICINSSYASSSFLRPNSASLVNVSAF